LQKVSLPLVLFVLMDFPFVVEIAIGATLDITIEAIEHFTFIVFSFLLVEKNLLTQYCSIKKRE
jgi:hypothetical protein